MSDIELYRLRAFEASFITPRVRILLEANRSDLEHALQQGQGESPTYQDQDHQTPQYLLNLCLLWEAATWVEVGAGVGYFPENSVPYQFRQLPEWLPFDGEGLWKALRVYVAFSDARNGLYNPRNDESWQDNFSKQLIREIELLTEERMEYLRLMLFASDKEWEKRYLQVQDTADVFERRADVAVSSDTMDSIAWALHGPTEEPDFGEEFVPEELLPSYWRHEKSWGLMSWEAEVATSVWSERAPRRRAVLDECRERFVKAARFVSVNEMTTVLLQKNQGGGSTSELTIGAPLEVQAIMTFGDTVKETVRDKRQDPPKQIEI